MLRLAFDFIITWRETRTRPNAYASSSYVLRRIFFEALLLLPYFPGYVQLHTFSA